MKILIIDNNLDRDSWGCENLRRYARTVPGATVVVRRAPEEDLPRSLSGFDRIVVSGSRTSGLADAPWISQLHELIRRAVDSAKPFLGVCYGHQELVRAIGGDLHLSDGTCPEYGWTQIERIADSPLWEGMPKTFYSFSSHADEVKTLPPGMRNLARSERCGVQACELIGRPVFGIQFHPEKDLPETEKAFAGWRQKPPKRRDSVFHAKKSRELYDPKIGEILFKNFFGL